MSSQPSITGPGTAPPAMPAAKRARRPALDVAAQSASTSYARVLPPEVLGEALRTGVMPAGFEAHIGTLLDEAPASMLARMVEQLHAEHALPHAQTWSTLRDFAARLKVMRDLRLAEIEGAKPAQP
jgi:hypothetical protein